jgi:hypothetical protein
MKTAISIPDALFEAAEKLAEKLGVTRSELYQRAVARLLADQAGESVTEALNQIYGSEQESGRLDPALQGMQSASLGEDDW